MVRVTRLREGASRRARLITGVVLTLGSVLVPFAAQATNPGTQMNARSATPTASTAAATVSYSFSFVPGTAGANFGAIKIEICDSPLETVSCAASASAGVNSNGANLAGSTLASGTLGGVTGTNSFTKGATTGPGTSGTSVIIKNSAASGTVNTSTPVTFTLNSVVNPAGNNQLYYVRFTSYNSTTTFTGTQEIDFGAVALETAQNISVNATVQEQLAFCAGATAATDCTSVGSGTINLSTGNASCPVLSSTYTCTGTSQMTAFTNAASGYVVTYNGTTFSNAGATDTITEAGSPGSTSAASLGTKFFGLAITGNTVGTGGVGSINATYDFSGNGSKYAYVSGSAQPSSGNPPSTGIVSAAGPSGSNQYTVTYAANISPTTKPGSYTATIKYVCTGLF